MAFIFEVPQIFLQRFYTGWITLRNQLATPIKVMGRRVVELYDALIAGNDWEITPKLSLKRRAGHTLYVNTTYPSMFLYSWKSNTMGTIPIIDTTQDYEYVSSAGAITQITTKTGGAGLNLQSSILGIGNYLYVGNSQTNFKWDGPSGLQGKTNWGINAAAATANTIGPTTAGAGSNTNNGGVAWTNPNNVTSAVSYATVSPGAFRFSQLLTANTFGLSVPGSSVITSISCTFDAFNTGNTLQSFNVQLTVNGSTVGNVVPVTLTGSSATYTLGGDMWGLTSLTPSQANSSTFGFTFKATQTGAPGSSNVSVRNVKVTLQALGGPAVSPTGSGSFSAVNGFSYVVAYGNSASGEISNASPISSNTGAFSSKSYVGVTVVASNDPQVNQIRVYRTTDSGGGNQFFEIPNSPFSNTGATIQDNAADTALQVTSQAEINLGNTPPPAGIINLEWFAGRMWGSVGNLLLASTGPETISGTAPNSNWNPAFQWVIPQPIIRNIRGPNGMLVFTVDDCYIVRGTDIVNYTVNEFVKNFGVRTYNAIDTDGTNLYVFTSDRQFICLTAAGADDLGLAIADQLQNVDPTSVYVTVNRYGLDSIVRILDTVNNVFYDYNLNQQCWNLPGILQMAACTSMGSIETSPGVWRLLVNTTNSGQSSLAYRDITNFQDLGTNYAPVAVFGSLQLADPGTLAIFNPQGGIRLQYTNAGQAPTLSVLPNDIGCDLTKPVGSQVLTGFVSLSQGRFPLTSPPVLGKTPKNFRNLTYYWNVGYNLPDYVEGFQMQLAAAAENQATELIGFGIFAGEKAEAASAGKLPLLQGK